MTKFQIIILSIFVVFIVTGVIAFATFRGSQKSTSIPPVTIWGTFQKTTFDQYVASINSSLSQPLSVNYVEIPQNQFSHEFISALARGQGPDAILISSESLLSHEDKIVPIPYDVISERKYVDTFIQEASIYLSSNGVRALPFTVNPLVMYWNRDIFDAAGIATYPRFWDEFASLNQKLTVKDSNGNIRKSAVAIGTFSNITNARELFGTLLMQTGNPITSFKTDGQIVSALKTSAPVNPTIALDFFTQFIDSANPNYSWNKSLPQSKTAFLSGILSTYFGFADEISDLRAKNPNLNFDVALLPQIRTGGIKVTYGQMFGLSILRSSQNQVATYQIMSILTSPDNLKRLSESLYQPSVRRDVIVQGSTDPYISLFNEAALVSRTWLDAEPAESTPILAEMVEFLVSGRKSSIQAVQDAGNQHDVVLSRIRR